VAVGDDPTPLGHQYLNVKIVLFLMAKVLPNQQPMSQSCERELQRRHVK
jgi:hypothetical protein